MDFIKALKLNETSKNTEDLSGWKTSTAQLQGSASSFSKSDFSDIHDLFDKACQENDFDCRISMKHVKVILKTLNFDKNVYDLNAIMGSLDPNKEGSTCLSALKEVIAMSSKGKCSEKELRRAFKLMDEDKKGFLDMNDLKKINDQLGEKMSEEELQAMIDEADESDLGIVNEDGFVRFMLKAQEDATKCNCVELKKS